MQSTDRHILNTTRALQEAKPLDPKDGEILVLRTAVGLLRFGIKQHLTGKADDETLRTLLSDTDGLESE